MYYIIIVSLVILILFIFNYFAQIGCPHFFGCPYKENGCPYMMTECFQGCPYGRRCGHYRGCPMCRRMFRRQDCPYRKNCPYYNLMKENFTNNDDIIDRIRNGIKVVIDNNLLFSDFKQLVGMQDFSVISFAELNSKYRQSGNLSNEDIITAITDPK